jgi:broad specificity phosphatase PhoE
MRILLVRHGESLGNVRREIHKELPDHAIPLSEKGKQQAEDAGRKLARYFKGEPRLERRCRLWTSPYERTRETADGIMKIASWWIADRKEHVLLCEQQFGLFDGLSDEELQELYPAEHAFYNKCKKFEGRFWARMPLGESRFDVAIRVHQAFGTFHRDNDKYGINDIVVVCHGVTLRAFVMMWCHLTPEWFDEEPNPGNGAIRLIDDGIDKGYL